MSYQMAKPEGKVARAFGNELRTSWKNAINVCRAIQGMQVRAAEQYLEDVIALRRAVPFTTHFRKVAHKPGMGPGRFPQKSAAKTLFVLRNAINNAEYQGHDPDSMVIVHASAYKGRTIKGFMPRAHGRASPKNEDTTNLEIIIREEAEPDSPERPQRARAAPKAEKGAKEAAPAKPGAAGATGPKPKEPAAEKKEAPAKAAKATKEPPAAKKETPPAAKTASAKGPRPAKEEKK